MVDGRVVAFVSPTHATAEVALNRDGFTLPPGFTVEVESVEDVGALHERRPAGQARTIEELKPDGSQFSVLDPSGRRVTVSASEDQTPSISGDWSRSVTRVIPGVNTNDPDGTRRFYVDYLGLEVLWAKDGMMIPVVGCAPGAGHRQHMPGESRRLRPRRGKPRSPRPDSPRRPNPVDCLARAH
jgi:hypothetical protein